jgi:hypothetical protein
VRRDLRVVVTGLIGQHPLGGVTWDYIQYVSGFADLGYDVYYVEDSGEWPYSSSPGDSGRYEAADCSESIAHLSRVMRRFGLADRWAFRCAIGSRWFGLSERRRREVLRTADLLVNVSGTLHRPEEYRSIPCLAYIDSDPVFTQIKIARAEGRFPGRVDAHDVHFSFGEVLGAAPQTRQHWLPTRQPIVLSQWRPVESRREVFTTVMNWTSYKPLEYGGKRFGQKNVEFKRFIDLPKHVHPVQLEVALRALGRQLTPGALVTRFRRKGWNVVDPRDVCRNVDGYRSYIETSKGEWSVAKNGYVEGRSGWFSCRSACYLAAGRPVVVQDTGFSEVLPTGEGIVSFSTVDEAAEGIQVVEGDYGRHARVARELAEEYFDSKKVLTRLIEEAMSESRAPEKATA